MWILKYRETSVPFLVSKDNFVVWVVTWARGNYVQLDFEAIVMMVSGAFLLGLVMTAFGFVMDLVSEMFRVLENLGVQISWSRILAICILLMAWIAYFVGFHIDSFSNEENLSLRKPESLNSTEISTLQEITHVLL